MPRGDLEVAVSARGGEKRLSRGTGLQAGPCLQEDWPRQKGGADPERDPGLGASGEGEAREGSGFSNRTAVVFCGEEMVPPRTLVRGPHPSHLLGPLGASGLRSPSASP